MAQLASVARTPPEGDDWLHELKFDGYRIMARLEAGRVELWTRSGNDWAARYPRIAAAVAALPARAALLDGEVVVQLPDGRSSFQALQGSSKGPGLLLYYAFDLLHLDGADLHAVEQLRRKEALLALVGSGVPPGSEVRYSDHVIGQGGAFLRQACAASLEGIVSKRVGAPYRAGRNGDWVKVKCLRSEEFVVVGYSEPAGSRSGFGALLLGTYEGNELVYRGKVGSGFSEKDLHGLLERLQRATRDSPTVTSLPSGAGLKGIHWVAPELVVQVEFRELTRDGGLRHPVFRGVREDKIAEQVASDWVPSAGAPLPSPLAQASSGGRQPDTAAVAKRTVRIAGVGLSNPRRVMYPEEGYTKEDLARYYEAVGAWQLPHLAGRPLMLLRCPQGLDGACFVQKHMEGMADRHIDRTRVSHAGVTSEYGFVSRLAGVVAAVQLGALEFHTWNCRIDRWERPDRVAFDIDPDSTINWDAVVQAAYELRLLLAELGLQSFVKTTGGKGLHVVVPLVRRSGWEETKRFARAVSATVAAASPERYTLQLAKARRRGRLLLDYLRNGRGATAIEVYSTRARPGAPVCTPISWEELEAGISPRDFTIETVPARVAAGKDPWRGYGAVKQSLTAPMLKRLGLR